MSKKYFGTDGIRGRANEGMMTAEKAMKVAMAAAVVMMRRSSDVGHKPRVVIGKDTRRSCYMLEQAMTSGFLSMGMNVVLTGPVPTPAIAMLTRSMRADIGIMISASHNPHFDNGIKLFGSDGFKLDDTIEVEIEANIDADLSAQLVEPEALGKAWRLDDALGRYVEFAKSAFPRRYGLEGMKIVLDCANGAAYKAAPQVFWELGADVLAIGDKPNGININDGVGATATEALQRAVVEHGADIGIALDGDADRLIVVDEKGARVDGDQIMALLAVWLKGRGQLSRDTMVATVMSNLGLERYLKSQGIALIRCAVGDRYVVEEMKKEGYSLGGEQSGHIVMLEKGTTGDGTLAALQVLAAVKADGREVSDIMHVFDKVPQLLKNVSYSGPSPMDQDSVISAIEAAQRRLANEGRVLVRASGTEPLIRVMAEGDDSALVESVVDDICRVIENVS